MAALFNDFRANESMINVVLWGMLNASIKCSKLLKMSLELNNCRIKKAIVPSDLVKLILTLV